MVSRISAVSPLREDLGHAGFFVPQRRHHLGQVGVRGDLVRLLLRHAVVLHVLADEVHADAGAVLLAGRGVGPQDVVVVLDVPLPVHAVQQPEHGHHLLDAVHADEHGQVIVELVRLLVADVEEEELLRLHGHRHGDLRGEAGHALVLEDLGVHAPEGGIIQHGDEAKRVPRRGDVHLAPGLVRLRLDGPVPQRAVLLLRVALGEVEPLDEVAVVPLPGNGELALEAVAGHPVGEVLGAEEVADADGPHHLARREHAHLGVGVGEAAVPEQGVPVKAARDHRHLQLRRVQLLLDRLQRLRGGAGGVQVVLEVVRVPGNEVVVMGGGEIDELLLPRLAEQVAHLDRGDAVHDGAAERVAHGVGHAPERHGKLCGSSSMIVSPSVSREARRPRRCSNQESTRRERKRFAALHAAKPEGQHELPLPDDHRGGQGRDPDQIHVVDALRGEQPAATHAPMTTIVRDRVAIRLRSAACLNRLW